MRADVTHNPFSPFAIQRRKGFRSLLFIGALEDDFRQRYSRSIVSRARVMPAFAIFMTIIAMAMRLSTDGPQLVMMAFDLGLLLPLLFATLYFSTVPERFKIYQALLALSGTLAGIVIVSIVFRATARGIPYYFTMETGWIFAVWLVLGLRIREAAATALAISMVHTASLFYLNYDVARVTFEILMLGLVNLIGATSCYQLEYAIRRSFLESRELEEMADEMEELAGRDSLTGLYNRRSFDSFIDRVWRQSRREMAPLTIMFIDLDHYKDYNDHYGHQAGDEVLTSVGKVISRFAKRPFDFAARYGGEEFVVVLYGEVTFEARDIADTGRQMADKLRRRVRALKIPHEKSSAGPYLTTSIGVAVIMPGAERSLAGAIQLADEALYKAKDEGRDCVVVSESTNTQMQTGEFRSQDLTPT
jgi:diguanylate cyclase (GGDEF)-like protein